MSSSKVRKSNLWRELEKLDARCAVDQLDFVQLAESLVLANYESDQDIAGVPDLSLQNLNLSADGEPSCFLSADKTRT